MVIPEEHAQCALLDLGLQLAQAEEGQLARAAGEEVLDHVRCRFRHKQKRDTGGMSGHVLWDKVYRFMAEER